MQASHIEGVTALQRYCFPPPFSEDLLWQPAHLEEHLVTFAEGQFVALKDGQVIGSCSNARLCLARYQRHLNWDETVGGPFLRHHNPTGEVLFGVDISVHPLWQGNGIGRALYAARFKLLQQLNLSLYGTACRMPGFLRSGYDNPEDYATAVSLGEETDRTLTPLLRMGLTFRGVVSDHMEDEESGHAAAILEWSP